jgi:membrane protease YdiL (CAAX protease family)
VSSPQNPWSEPGLLPAQPPPAPLTAMPCENPAWGGWDVLQIVVLTLVSVFVFWSLVGVAAHRLLYPKVAVIDLMAHPLVAVLGQVFAYLLILAFMVSIVKRVPSRDFWQAIRWNWPKNWSTYLLAGVALSFGLQGIAHFLPIPKQWALSLFGITFAPLFEELFFRGFLYPVLARQFGVAIAVLTTAGGFSRIHAQQLGRAWGPLLLIFIVGLALTITRAVTKSVAAGLIMHMAYNGTLSILLFAGTSGFRHLERLNQ